MAEQIDPKTVKALRKLADLGDADAQFDLGELFHHGLGAVQDDEEAEVWWAKAAAQGHAEARVQIGVSYRRRASTFLKGEKLERSHAEALRWYKLAAQQGDATSQFYVGHMYEKSLGVARNYLEARSWYLVASRQGFQAAEGRLAKLEDRIRRSKTTWEELMAEVENTTPSHLEGVRYHPRYQAPEHMTYEIDETSDDEPSDDDLPDCDTTSKPRAETDRVAPRANEQAKEKVQSSPKADPKLDGKLPSAEAEPLVPQVVLENDAGERRILQTQIDTLTDQLAATRFELAQATSRAAIAVGWREEAEARMRDLQRQLDTLQVQIRNRRWWQVFWVLSWSVVSGAMMYALART